VNSHQSQLPSPEVIWKASKESVLSGKGNHKLSGAWQLIYWVMAAQPGILSF